jgi:hypothetical protein
MGLMPVSHGFRPFLWISGKWTAIDLLDNGLEARGYQSGNRWERARRIDQLSTGTRGKAFMA